MAYYWVNLGTSYREVLEDSFLWSPTHQIRNGKKTHKTDWSNTANIKLGDVIFCHNSGEIIAVAIAKMDAYRAERPKSRTFDIWGIEGNKVEVDLIQLNTPVDTSVFRHELFHRFNSECVPKLLTQGKHQCTQSYLVKIPKGAASFVFDHLNMDLIKVADYQSSTLNKKRNPKKTKREAIINARIGQGQFRKDLFKQWDAKCPVTGVDVPELLVASHIVPWALANDEEKVDPNNGILLSPSIDKLFDKSFISFNDEGSIIVHLQFNKENLVKLGVAPRNIKVNFNKANKKYLAAHREIFKF
ncbi:HNH endonuclease signature motif containing protein [Pseudoalteromonas piscicida]|uniref:HNH endonuclease n=1 Tax=Pseudoalteromonas piscicida TaxID=43662 RepID=UPI002738FC28|nr:HNH endonuclease signature motif containing protein [Pseudoalteromonas piscicida]MDP4489911.1 HNH endonuclease signature motif containing protein [Pseudoalteromonas piscicida]